jgi:hypothetical protein
MKPWYTGSKKVIETHLVYWLKSTAAPYCELYCEEYEMT